MRLFLGAVWEGETGVEEEDFGESVGFGVEEGVVEVLEAGGTGLEGVALEVGEVQRALEPLGAEVALETVGVYVVDMAHLSYEKSLYSNHPKYRS